MISRRQSKAPGPGWSQCPESLDLYVSEPESASCILMLHKPELQFDACQSHTSSHPECSFCHSIISDVSMGNLFRLINPPKATFTDADLQRQDGKVIVITGGYSGVGFELAKILLEKGAHVYVVSRSQEKGDEMVKEIGENGKGQLTFIQMDLADLDSVYLCSQKIAQMEAVVQLQTRDTS